MQIDAAYVRRHFLGRSFPTVARMIRDELGHPLPGDFERRYRQRLLMRFEDDLRPTPGLLPMLNRLSLAACVATSSSPERVRRTLDLLGLSSRFAGRIFTASQVANGKPAPDLFLLAAATLGADPARTLVIEDSPPGLIAARAAGMHTLAYTGGAHLGGIAPDLPFPVRSFDNWANFPHLLENGTEGTAPE